MATPRATSSSALRLCTVKGCRAPAARSCPLCAGGAAYCTPGHQFDDWLVRHKDECSYAASSLGAYDVAKLWAASSVEGASPVSGSHPPPPPLPQT